MQKKNKKKTPSTSKNGVSDIRESDELNTNDLEASVSEEEAASLRTEIEQLKDTILRRTADFENMRRRMSKERLQMFEDAKISAIESFLPVYDDLSRTLFAASEQDIPPVFLDGVQLIAEKFRHVLEAHGIEAINETGVPFDVHVHDALLRQPAPDAGTPSNSVLQILETGYRLGNRVIRHAKVIVTE